MSADPKKFYLTTPIYYVNARPHIGHAYTTIVADVLARRHRLLGPEEAQATFFLTGTDEHGQKIERSAAAAGIAPQQFADEVAGEFRKLWDRMGLTYDKFIRTTDPEHKRGVQKLFNVLYERGYIYLDSYTGQYCVSDEVFVDVPVGAPCPDCGRITETVTEENFFFKLSAFQQALLDLIESDTLAITPESRKNEVLSFLRGGLKDLSISRSSFTWGIPVPEEVQQKSGAKQKHVIYVWLDALANYMTAIGYGSDDAKDAAEFARYWPADLHLVGKEIIRFHCIYWPAFLLAADLPLPKAVTAHGWLLFDNAKMSKSKGNIVRTETILEAFGEHVYAKQFPDSTKRERDLFAADVLRYFLLREIPFGQDGSFSFDAMVTRYNADLANGYGNLVSRTLNLIQQNLAGVVAEPVRPWLCESQTITEPDNERQSFEKAFSNTTSMVRGMNLVAQDGGESIDAARFELFVSRLAMNIGQVDAYLTANAPWKLKNSEDPLALQRMNEILYTAAESIRIITALLYPILPATTAKVWRQLGLGEIETASRAGDMDDLEWGGLKPGTKLGPLAPIFPRADKSLAQIMIDMENGNAVNGTNDASNDNRPETPLKSASTPTAAEPVASDSTHPGAAPRTSGFDEPSGTLSVGGSGAVTTERPGTPPHAEAQASGPFSGVAAQVPVSAGPANASPQITIDDFAKVELRVAQIVVAERIPKADKLLRLEVDLGPEFPERRQILSGIAEWYTPEELIGRRIVVITNLAPRKMRGLESHGMLLAASDGEGGKPVLATFGEEIALGSRLK
jgi:methionyl-tRNA synthetase